MMVPFGREKKGLHGEGRAELDEEQKYGWRRHLLGMFYFSLFALGTWVPFIKFLHMEKSMVLKVQDIYIWLYGLCSAKGFWCRRVSRAEMWSMHSP